MKINDVFTFQYGPKEEQGWDSRGHCFEGLLVVCAGTPEPLLIDTFWGIGDRTGRVFTVDEINAEVKKGGRFEFYCNLDEIEPIQEYEQNYYSDSDLFCIHTQHACHSSCKKYHIRKGARKSKEKMLEVVRRKIEDTRHKIDSGVRDMERLSITKNQIESGELDKVYL